MLDYDVTPIDLDVENSFARFLQNEQMSRSAIPSHDEFRKCVLAAYAPAMREFGFVEFPPRHGRHVNRFTVRLGNATTTIEVQGINWGTAAWTRVFRTPESDSDYDDLPINKLLQLRLGLSAKEVEKAQKRRRKQPDQLGDIRDTAAAILEHARDVLSGNFSALEEIADQERRFRQEQLDKALPVEQKGAIVAASRAGHAFKRGDYRKVVELLEPHLPNLSASERKRLATARRLSDVQQE